MDDRGFPTGRISVMRGEKTNLTVNKHVFVKTVKSCEHIHAAALLADNQWENMKDRKGFLETGEQKQRFGWLIITHTHIDTHTFLLCS